MNLPSPPLEVPIQHAMAALLLRSWAWVLMLILSVPWLSGCYTGSVLLLETGSGGRDSPLISQHPSSDSGASLPGASAGALLAAPSPAINTSTSDALPPSPAHSFGRTTADVQHRMASPPGVLTGAAFPGEISPRSLIIQMMSTDVGFPPDPTSVCPGPLGFPPTPGLSPVRATRACHQGQDRRPADPGDDGGRRQCEVVAEGETSDPRQSVASALNWLHRLLRGPLTLRWPRRPRHRRFARGWRPPLPRSRRRLRGEGPGMIPFRAPESGVVRRPGFSSGPFPVLSVLRKGPLRMGLLRRGPHLSVATSAAHALTWIFAYAHLAAQILRLLLLIAGIEPHPGPAMCEKCREEVSDGRREKVTQASYAFPGDPARRCKEHKEDGMENVVSKRCEKCKKRPTFAYPGEPARLCQEHMEDGMEDVRSKRCEKCKKRPTFAYPGEPARLCKKHKEDGMENVVSKRCERCEKQPTFALPGERPRRCADHVDEPGMVNVVSTKCSECGEKGPTWGHRSRHTRAGCPHFAFGKPRYCGKHHRDASGRARRGVVNISEEQLKWAEKMLREASEEFEQLAAPTAVIPSQVRAAAQTTASYINEVVVPACPHAAIAVCSMHCFRVRAETGATSCNKSGYFVNTEGEEARVTLGEALNQHGAKQVVLGVFRTPEDANAFEKEVHELTEATLAPKSPVDPGVRPPAHRITRRVGAGGTSAPKNIDPTVAGSCVQYVVAMFILPDGLPRGLGFLEGDSRAERALAKKRARANDVAKQGSVAVPDPPLQLLAESSVLAPVKGGGPIPVPDQGVADRQRQRLTEITGNMQYFFRAWCALKLRVAASKREEGESLTTEEERLLSQELEDDEEDLLDAIQDAMDEDHTVEDDPDEGDPVEDRGVVPATPAPPTPRGTKRKAKASAELGRARAARGRRRG